MRPISPHYRSVGRGQGSNAVFLGSRSLSFGVVSPFYPVHIIHCEVRLFYQKINQVIVKNTRKILGMWEEKENTSYNEMRFDDLITKSNAKRNLL